LVRAVPGQAPRGRPGDAPAHPPQPVPGSPACARPGPALPVSLHVVGGVAADGRVVGAVADRGLRPPDPVARMSKRRGGGNASADAVVIGSGPNGLAAAITLARSGESVTVFEAADTPGGGARSAELTLPGFVHDVCSAIYPFGRTSPAFAASDLGR